MGTNLNQVFILNTANLETGTNFASPTAGDVGIWTLDDTNHYTAVNEPLYQTTFSPLDTDTDTGDGSTPTATAALTFANPAWLFNELQIVQGTAGNPVASPLINTRDIKRVEFNPFEATAGHKVVCTPHGTFTAAANATITLKVIVRSTPTDQLSFHDADATNYGILSGTDAFPLGAFNTTNHKAISVEFTTSSTATFCSAGKEAVDGHALLSKLVTATDTGTGTSLDLQSKHVGFTFDVVITDNTGASVTAASAATDKVVAAVTGQVLGTGNDWQVLGDEIRCRGRYGNFNRMYIPQNMPTYTTVDYQYHKFTIEYAHNWPSSTGIAPAGELNQIVIYAADSSTAMAAGDTTIDLTFGLANVTARQDFMW